jgi:hypothetical protein
MVVLDFACQQQLFCTHTKLAQIKI